MTSSIFQDPLQKILDRVSGYAQESIRKVSILSIGFEIK